MRSMKRVLGGGVLLSILGATAIAAHGCGKDDPQPAGPSYPADEIDELSAKQSIVVPGLREPVRAVRDKRGMMHIYARNHHDAAVAEGYLMAYDRGPQLEVLRRVAEGRLASLLGNVDRKLATRDLVMRQMRLRKTAEKYYATLKEGSDEKAVIDGFAEGVTAFFREIREGKAKQIPNGWFVVQKKDYEDWDPVSTLAIARLQTWALGFYGDQELEYTALLDKAQETFSENAADPAFQARKNFPLDAMRFAPAIQARVLDTPGIPGVGGATNAKSLPSGALPRPNDLPNFSRTKLSRTLLSDLSPAFRGMGETRDFLGDGGTWSSNNWIVAPSKSATGASLVASDPHLGMPAPAVFWMGGIHVLSDDPAKRYDAAGMIFAGTPIVVLGFNKDISWGATVAVFDVQDLYRFKVDGDKVTVKGEGGAPKTIQIVRHEETIDYGDGTPVPIVIEEIPGYGFVTPTIVDDRWVPRTSDEVLSIRWTGMEPSAEYEAFFGLGKSKTTDEAMKALEIFEVGAQNFVIGDNSGNIAYRAQARVPTRPAGMLAWDAKTARGKLPCLVQEGSDGFEWTGNVPLDQLPQAKNPEKGWLASANNDQFGLSFDNDPSNGPVYLSCLWDYGYRQARAQELLGKLDKVSLDDMARIQGDAQSPLGRYLSQYLIAAIEKAEAARTSGTVPAELQGILADPRWDPARIGFALQVLKGWAAADWDTPAALPIKSDDPQPTAKDIAASQATFVFNATMVALYKNVLDDEWEALGRLPWYKDLQTRAIIRILQKPEPLATADATGESVLWDDLRTKDVVETRDQIILKSFLEGLDFVVTAGGPDPDGWRWGKVHGVTFVTMLSGTESELSIPSSNQGFPKGVGFPRHGDEANLDRSDYGMGGKTWAFKFTYAMGPAQRFVASMEKDKPVVRNVLAGGNSWRPSSPYFDNEVQLWRKNQNGPIAFTPGEVVPEADERIDLVPR
jgi:penicillin amidase